MFSAAAPEMGLARRFPPRQLTRPGSGAGRAERSSERRTSFQWCAAQRAAGRGSAGSSHIAVQVRAGGGAGDGYVVRKVCFRLCLCVRMCKE